MEVPQTPPQGAQLPPGSQMAKLQTSRVEVRCECSVCGAHAFAIPEVAGSGRCGNCHSDALVPLPGGRELAA